MSECHGVGVTKCRDRAVGFFLDRSNAGDHRLRTGNSAEKLDRFELENVLPKQNSRQQGNECNHDSTKEQKPPRLFHCADEYRPRLKADHGHECRQPQ